MKNKNHIFIKWMGSSEQHWSSCCDSCRSTVQNLGILKINSYRQYCGSALVSICIQGEKTMRIQILAGLTNTIT